jgi:hypothetical protein
LPSDRRIKKNTKGEIEEIGRERGLMRVWFSFVISNLTSSPCATVGIATTIIWTLLVLLWLLVSERLNDCLSLKK